MKLHPLLKSGGLTALALALAAPAFTTPVLAQESSQRGNWRGGNNDNGGARNAGRNERAVERQAQRAERQQQRQAQAPQARQQQQAAPPQAQQQRSGNESRWGQRGDNGGNWNGGNRERPTMGNRQRQDGADRPQGNYAQRGRDTTQTQPQTRDWNRDRNTGDRNAGDRNWADNRTQGTRDWNRDGQRDGQRDWNRDRNWSDNNRNRDYRDNDRNRDYRDRDRNGSYRDGYRDARNNYGRDQRRWDRRWRDDHRYDWNRYRYANRDHYRLGRYYAPYRNYSYRRLSIGFYLDNLFFGNRYWINDPWSYRLPQVYGSYRWVRYYDDVLLVDMYSGEVVDVIYDFFW
jgi:hypothetical protein